MYLGLKVLNSDAVLNNFEELNTVSIVRGADAKVVMRLVQPAHKGLRYVPASGATFSITLQNSDGTTLVKTPTQPFADDRSILQITLSEAETAALISQGLNVEMNEGAEKTFAVLQSGLQVNSLTGDC